jgi:hypothetical protein
VLECRDAWDRSWALKISAKQHTGVHGGEVNLAHRAGELGVGPQVHHHWVGDTHTYLMMRCIHTASRVDDATVVYHVAALLCVLVGAGIEHVRPDRSHALVAEHRIYLTGYSHARHCRRRNWAVLAACLQRMETAFGTDHRRIVQLAVRRHTVAWPSPQTQ